MAKTNKQLAAENAELKKQLEATAAKPGEGAISVEDVNAINAKLAKLEKENAELKEAKPAKAASVGGLPAGVDPELLKAKMSAGLPRETAVEVCLAQAKHDEEIKSAKKG